ncbi:MAG: aminotransferase class III-fold pyridoxal phosphate-dependent enzyme, partial [Pseudomonadota bacterium]
MSLRDLEQAVCLPVYSQLDLEPGGAGGVYIHCKKRGKVLDMYGGHAVAALGYGHPALTQAVLEQTESMVFQSNAVALQERVDAARKLIDFAPDFVERVFFCNSGGEANENALRMDCMVTGR